MGNQTDSKLVLIKEVGLVLLLALMKDLNMEIFMVHLL